jgi:hypothetical protein
MPGKTKAVKKSVKKRMGGGMMGPKKKMARGGAVKKRGGGMMGPKKKMAKGGMTGRDAAAKKASGAKDKGSTKKQVMAALKQGKGNPAGKDLSLAGRFAAARKRKPSGRITADDLRKVMQRLGRGKKK